MTTGVSSLETKRVIEENGGICVGIACVVDRTRAEAPSPIPIVASALKLDLPNYAPEECPICKEGKLPAGPPGQPQNEGSSEADAVKE